MSPEPFFQTKDDDTVRVYSGDCIELMKGMPHGKVQTAICSPPYWGLGDYGPMPWVGGDKDCPHDGAVDGTPRGSGGSSRVYKKFKLHCPDCGADQDPRRVGARPTLDEFIKQMVNVGRGVWDILADDGTWWLNLDDSYVWKGTGLPAGNRILSPHRVAIALQEDGWICRQDLVYSKVAPFFESVKNRCTRSHEYIFLMTKHKSDYYYDAESIREENLKGTGDHNRLSVWRINHKGFKGGHLATFPTTLVEPCVLAGSQEGDIVFDPFTGSGSTICTALQNGRRGWGTELLEKHLHEHTIGRIKQQLADVDKKHLIPPTDGTMVGGPGRQTSGQHTGELDSHGDEI